MLLAIKKEGRVLLLHPLSPTSPDTISHSLICENTTFDRSCDSPSFERYGGYTTLQA